MTRQQGLLCSIAASLTACCSLSNYGHTATSPGRFSAFSKRVFLLKYLLVKQGGIPLAMPHSSSSVSHQRRTNGQGDLRITVRVRLHGPLIPPALRTLWCFWMSTLDLGSGDDDSAALPPSGRVALPESDPERTAMLSRAAESIWTTLQLLRASTAKAVYASVACRNSPDITSGVRSI